MLLRFRAHYTTIACTFPNNNRLLPGFGQLDFTRIFRLQAEIGYTESLALEGNIRGSFTDDLEEHPVP